MFPQNLWPSRDRRWRPSPTGSVRFLATVLLIPARLRFFPGSGGESHRGEDARRSFSSRVADWVLATVVPRPKLTLFVALLIGGGAIYFALDLRVSNDLLSFLREDANAVVATNRLEENFDGTHSIRASLSGEPGGFKRVEALRWMERIAEEIEQLPGVDGVQSFSSVVARLNGQLRGLPDGKDALPFIPPAAEHFPGPQPKARENPRGALVRIFHRAKRLT